MTPTFNKPPVAIFQTDHTRLLRLAETLTRRNSDLADELFAELERAEVLQDSEDSRVVVRMGSTLQYESESGETRTVTLVFPQEEDISAGKISILTPIGVALIGLSLGDSINWRTRDGRVQRLTVTRVVQPGADSTEAKKPANVLP